MSRRIAQDQLAASREITARPDLRSCHDHSFELPPAIYGMMAGLFTGFVAVLCLALRNPGLAVPFGVIAAFILAFFAIPALFVRSAPKDEPRSPSWVMFMERGIATEAGRCSGREAVVLALLLPVFIFLWGVAIALIVSLG